MRAAKVQASLRIRALSPEPPLLAHTSIESRGTFNQKARSLVPLGGWACAIKICHDGMLEDTNSLDSAPLCVDPFLKLWKNPICALREYLRAYKAVPCIGHSFSYYVTSIYEFQKQIINLICVKESKIVIKIGIFSTINRNIENQTNLMLINRPFFPSPRFSPFLGGNLGSLLHGDVSMMVSVAYCCMKMFGSLYVQNHQ